MYVTLLRKIRLICEHQSDWIGQRNDRKEEISYPEALDVHGEPFPHVEKKCNRLKELETQSEVVCPAAHCKKPLTKNIPDMY